MARHKDANWSITETPNTFEGCQLAVLMDIRDELKEINRHLKCGRYEERRAEEAAVRIDKRLQLHLPLQKRKRK